MQQDYKVLLTLRKVDDCRVRHLHNIVYYELELLVNAICHIEYNE